MGAPIHKIHSFWVLIALSAARGTIGSGDDTFSREPIMSRRTIFLGLAEVWLLCGNAPAGDWPQWGGSDCKNMASPEKDLPATFVPGEKDPLAGSVKMETTANVRWAVKLCQAIYSTPVVAHGRIFIGGQQPGLGLMMCLDERTGALLWQWQGPARKIPTYIDGSLIGIGPNPEMLGTCSSPIVDGERVYFVTHSFKVLCLDAQGQRGGAGPGQARVVWEYDLWDRLGVFPCDAANGSPAIDGDFLYVQTSNGVDRNMGPAKEKNRQVPAPEAPNLIVLEKKTGRLAATDAAPIAPHLLHGQWSSVSLGTVAGRRLVFYGGGDGRCYAFEALSSAPEEPVKLKTVWSYDCIPAEYKSCGDWDPVSYYCLGDKRTKETLNKNDGTFVGMSEIIGTPVLYRDRIYVAIGRDPEHGRGRGALHCINATKLATSRAPASSGATRVWTGPFPRSRSPRAWFTFATWAAASTVWMRRPASAIGSSKPTRPSGAPRSPRMAKSICPRPKACTSWPRARRSASWARSAWARPSMPPRWRPMALSTSLPRAVGFGR